MKVKFFVVVFIFFLVVIAFLILKNPPTCDKTANFMNTTISISAEGWGADKKIATALDSVSDVEKHMSKSNATSDISGINSGNSYWGNSETVRVINRGIYYGNLSNGAFDISIGALEDLYKNNLSPSVSDISKAKALVNYKNLILWQPIPKGMSIDIDSMIKGYAGDEAILSLRQSGITNILVNIGEDCITSGDKNWKVGIHNPFDTNSDSSFIGTLEISNKAMATVNGSKVVYDPRTGKPVDNGIESATVITNLSGMDADAMANICYIMGKDAIPIIKQQGADCILITNDKQVITTFGDNSPFTITDKNFKLGV